VMDDRPPPWESALEAYRRTHPHREGDLDAAFASYDPDAQVSEAAAVAPAAASGSDTAAVSEHNPAATLFDSEGAREAAVAGMAKAERAARVQRWKAGAVAWVRDLSIGHEFVADDVVAALGLPDPSAGPATNNVVGAVFSSLSKARLITFTGKFKASERVIGHGNLQRVWRRS